MVDPRLGNSIHSARKLNRLWAWAGAVVVLASGLVIVGPAASAGAIDGCTGGDDAPEWSDAEGAYLITDQYELAYINSNEACKDDSFVMTDDITIDDEDLLPWSAIDGFSGSFDGQNYTISGFTWEDGFEGIFNTSDGAEISNLIVDITGGASTGSGGGLIGTSSGSVTVQHVRVEIADGTSIEGSDHVGGIIGYADDVNLDEVRVNGDIVATGSNAGGFIGYASGAVTILDSERSGDISGTMYIGGLVGYIDGALTVDDGVPVHGSVVGTVADGSVDEISYLGGIVGYAADDVDVANADVTGSVTTGFDVTDDIDGFPVRYVGGFIGWAEGAITIDQSSFDGDVTATITSDGEVTNTHVTYIGGLVGYGSSDVTISSFERYGDLMATIEADVVTTSSVTNVGGLVGQMDGHLSTTDTSLTSDVATGIGSEGDDLVDAAVQSIGGLVGYVGDGATIENLVFDDEDSVYATLAADVNNVEDSNVQQVGGVVGVIDGPSTMTSVELGTDVVATIGGDASVGNTMNYVGGVVGSSSANLTMDDVSHVADVTAAIEAGESVGNSLEYVGGLAGSVAGEFAPGTTDHDGSVNARIEISQASSTHDSMMYVGGLAGSASVLTAGFSTVLGDVTAEVNVAHGSITSLDLFYVGGLAGSADGESSAESLITNVEVSAQVTAGEASHVVDDTDVFYVGGALGSAGSNFTFARSQLAGPTSVVVSGYDDVTDSSVFYAGGVVGSANGTLTVRDVSVGGIEAIAESPGGGAMATLDGFYVGGVAGNTAGQVVFDRVAVGGDVEANADAQNVGGFIGFAASLTNISDSYLHGEVGATSSSAGGALGGTADIDATFRNTYLLTDAEAFGEIGGSADIEVYSSFCIDEDVCSGGVPMDPVESTGDFQLLDPDDLHPVYLLDRGWDFDSTWCNDPTLNDGYPSLRAYGGSDNFSCASRVTMDDLVSDAPWGSNILATLEDGEFHNDGTTLNSLWFVFTADSTGGFLLDTCDSNFDTVLAVWANPPGMPGATDDPMVIADDVEVESCGLPDEDRTYRGSIVGLRTVEDSTYYVQVSGYLGGDDEEGSFVLQGHGTEANDDFENAQAIDAGTTSGSNRYATLQTNEYSQFGVGSDTTESTVWYAYTAESSATVSIDLCESDFDTVLTVWNSESMPIEGDTPLALNDDSVDIADCGAEDHLGSSLTFTAKRGQTYILQVGGYGNMERGSFDLALSVGASSSRTPRNLFQREVILDPAGGTCDGHSTPWTVRGRHFVNLPSATSCSRDGFRLQGWTRDPSVTAPSSLFTTTFERSGNLTAVWARVPKAPTVIGVLRDFLCDRCGSALLVWAVPVDDVVVTGSEATVDGRLVDCAPVAIGEWRLCGVTGLVSGQVYEFAVRSTGAAGAGPPVSTRV